MWAVVPLKQLEQAKARLASVLSTEERRALMLAMARDVLTALGRSSRLNGILIVSRTPELLDGIGSDVLEEESRSSGSVPEGYHRDVGRSKTGQPGRHAPV